MNVFQLGVMHGLGWLFVLFDGWVLHSHWLAVIGFIFLTVSIWRMRLIKEPEDDEFDRIQREQDMKMAEGWRKRQVMRVKSFDDAFNDYLDNMGAPRTANNEEVRRHFNAGWVAGIRNEWAKERND